MANQSGMWWVEYSISPGVRVCWYVAAPDEWTAVKIAANRSAEVLGYRPDPSTLYRVVPRLSANRKRGGDYPASQQEAEEFMSWLRAQGYNPEVMSERALAFAFVAWRASKAAAANPYDPHE